MKLLQSQVAQQIGVDEATVCGWENNRSFPVLKFLPGIISFLGYIPFDKAETLAERVVIIRKVLGITQEELAERIHANPCTLARWERGDRRPIKRFQEDLNALYESLLSGT